jgi:hypothetical protein
MFGPGTSVATPEERIRSSPLRPESLEPVSKYHWANIELCYSGVCAVLNRVRNQMTVRSACAQTLHRKRLGCVERSFVRGRATGRTCGYDRWPLNPHRHRAIACLRGQSGPYADSGGAGMCRCRADSASPTMASHRTATRTASPLICGRSSTAPQGGLWRVIRCGTSRQLALLSADQRNIVTTGPSACIHRQG